VFAWWPPDFSDFDGSWLVPRLFLNLHPQVSKDTQVFDVNLFEMSVGAHQRSALPVAVDNIAAEHLFPQFINWDAMVAS
jgi:hypothetical protein